MLALTGDIGGTHSRFAVFERQSESIKLIESKRFKNKDFPNFEAVLEEFTSHFNLSYDVACLALATPIGDYEQPHKLTNCEWTIDSKKLKNNLKLNQFLLINDFTAIPYGLNYLSKLELFNIQSGTQKPDKPFVFIGPGTGLGVSLLARKNNLPLQVISSEAGHTTFSPAGKTQLALYHYLLSNKITPIWENILSGTGLIRLHQFLNVIKTDSTPELITKVGIKNPDSIEKQTLKLFLDCLASFSKNLTLSTLADELYFCGNILTSIMPVIDQEDLKVFCSHYNKHDTHSNIMHESSLKLILNTEISLYGAADFVFNNA